MNDDKKLKGADKLAHNPIKIAPTESPLRKPDWIRIQLASHQEIMRLKRSLKNKGLITVCEEASCPNLAECFAQGTATFMIMGDRCTRHCSFCDVAHGKPSALDPKEPERIAGTIAELNLRYAVITSVTRDDLPDGGAAHFAAVVNATRARNPGVHIEILVPDFRGRMETAFDALAQGLPDVFNHNIETVPRLYTLARPGASYEWSLQLLQAHKERFPKIPTKSGLMLGLGETDDEIRAVLKDLREHKVEMLTLGQYLQPSRYHLPVARYVTPEAFHAFKKEALNMGFSHVASGPLVRSSYHAEQQVAGEEVS